MVTPRSGVLHLLLDTHRVDYFIIQSSATTFFIHERPQRELRECIISQCGFTRNVGLSSDPAG